MATLIGRRPNEQFEVTIQPVENVASKYFAEIRVNGVVLLKRHYFASSIIGEYEVTLFARAFLRSESLLGERLPLIVKARVMGQDRDEREPAAAYVETSFCSCTLKGYEKYPERILNTIWAFQLHRPRMGLEKRVVFGMNCSLSEMVAFGSCLLTEQAVLHPNFES